MSKPVKAFVIGAGGGHLTESLLATEGVPIDRIIITFRMAHTEETLKSEKVRYIVDPHGNLIKYLINFLQSFYILLRDRPKVIINTGGGISIATSLLGKFLFRSKLIYIESGARVTTASKTGDLMYKHADLFIVQWKGLLKFVPNAV